MTRNTVPGRFGRHGRMLFASVGVLGAAALLSAAVASAATKGVAGHGTGPSASPASLLVKPVAADTGLNAAPASPADTGRTATPGSADTGMSAVPGSPAGTVRTVTPGSPASTATMDSRPVVPGGSVARGRYSFRTLDDAADPTFNQLLGINDQGRIAGYFGSGADAAHPNKGYVIYPRYRQSQFANENFPGSVQTQVVGINNLSVTVGFFVDGGGANVGFVKRNGYFTAVTNPSTPADAPFTQQLGVNDHNVAVGFYNDAAGAAHGFTYNLYNGTFRPVHIPVAADAVTATGINDNGDVSGFYVNGKITRGFLIRYGRFHPLSFGAGTNTQALGVNDGGRVVGSYLGASGVMHGFVWSRGTLTRVDAPHGTGGTLVNGLNNRGQIVGFYVDGAGLTHGFLGRRSS